MITYYQTLNYGKGAIVKTETAISGRGIKQIESGKYTATNAALKGLSKKHGVENQDGQELFF